MINWNSGGDYPQIDNTAYIHSTAVIIGKVNIGRNVFVGPTAVIRADEPGSSIIVKDNCNVQDRVIIHALEDSSVLIEENTSLAHGCIVHGPCKVGKNCFIGFGSVVFKAEIGDGVCIKHLVIVEGVDIISERIIESHRLVNCEEDARDLGYADKKTKDFMEKVIKVNLNLIKGYKRGGSEHG
ncbi:MAG: carbonate dehydratase [Candidatus Omnitrophica bacterium]|nr:carbonate dehydratase [Candidatus Omnitrophota bacterium]